MRIEFDMTRDQAYALAAALRFAVEKIPKGGSVSQQGQNGRMRYMAQGAMRGIQDAVQRDIDAQRQD